MSSPLLQKQDRNKQVTMESLTNLYDKITIEEEDEFGLVIEQDKQEAIQSKPKWCLVRKFLTESDQFSGHEEHVIGAVETNERSFYQGS